MQSRPLLNLGGALMRMSADAMVAGPTAGRRCATRSTEATPKKPRAESGEPGACITP